MGSLVWHFHLGLPFVSHTQREPGKDEAGCHFSSFLLLFFGASWWLLVMARQAVAHLRG